MPSTSISPPPATQTDESLLVTSHGRTTIADTVAQQIAGLAACRVSRVHDLGGGGLSGMLATVRSKLSTASSSGPTQGVSVEVGEHEAAVDVRLVAEYSVPIPDTAARVRRAVVDDLERLTGLRVVEVNVSVQDVHLPSEDDGSPAESWVE